MQSPEKARQPFFRPWVAVMLLLLVTFFVLAHFVLFPALFPRASATAPPRDEHWFYYSSPERVDALFWDMVSALKPLTVRMLTSKDLTNEGLGSFDNIPSDKWLKAAERKYGDMPEYWQLRFMVENYGKRTHTITVNQAIERAVQAAPDDPVSYWLYAVEYNYGEMPAKDEETARRIRQCTELAPEQAFYYGELAVWLNRCGYFDEAVENIRQATGAPTQTYIAPFPVGYVRYLLGKDSNLSSSQITGLAAFLNCRLGRWFLTRTKIYDGDVFDDGLSRLGEPGDMSTLNVLHHYACSRGLQDGAGTIEMLQAIIFVRTLTDGVEKAGVWKGDKDALKGLERMVDLRKQSVDAAKSQPASTLSQYINYDIENMTCTPVKEGSAWLPDFESEIVAYELQPDPREDDLRRLLREMAKFDYTNPAAFVEENGESGD